MGPARTVITAHKHAPISLDEYKPHASLYSLRTGNKATMERCFTQVKAFYAVQGQKVRAAQECSQFSS